jgi:hypothetical protein
MTHDTDDTDDNVDHAAHAVFLTRRAERLRRKAIDIAADYQQLATRHALDPGVVALDVAAVVTAWSALPETTATTRRAPRSDPLA